MVNAIKITDFNAPELNVFVRLTGAQLRNKLEPEKAVFIAESPTVIKVALESGCEPVSFLTDERLLGGAVLELSEKLANMDVPIYCADREILRSLTGFELTRGALCAMRRPRERELPEVLNGARRVAVLEQIADSTNVGAIFRCAAALGADAVLLTPTCCDPLCRRAVRVSMGTVFKVPFTRVCDSAQEWRERGIEILHSHGFKTCAMALTDNSVGIEDEKLAGEEKLAIILGTEGDGLMETTIKNSDYTVKIPMSNDVDSLNVACAAAIAFFNLRKRG